MVNVLLIVLMFVGFPAIVALAVYKLTRMDSNWKIGISVVFAIIWVAALIMSMNQEAQLSAEGMRGIAQIML